MFHILQLLFHIIFTWYVLAISSIGFKMSFWPPVLSNIENKESDRVFKDFISSLQWFLFYCSVSSDWLFTEKAASKDSRAVILLWASFEVKMKGFESCSEFNTTKPWKQLRETYIIWLECLNLISWGIWCHFGIVKAHGKFNLCFNNSF